MIPRIFIAGPIAASHWGVISVFYTIPQHDEKRKMFPGSAVFFFLKRARRSRSSPLGQAAASRTGEPPAALSGTLPQALINSVILSFYLSCYVPCSNDSMMVSGGTLYICDNFSRKVFTIPVD